MQRDFAINYVGKDLRNINLVRNNSSKEHEKLNAKKEKDYRQISVGRCQAITHS